jgi:hypothetical protein
MWKTFFLCSLSICVVTDGTQPISVQFGIGVPHYELLRLHIRHLKVVIPVVNTVFVVVLKYIPKPDTVHTAVLY